MDSFKLGYRPSLDGLRGIAVTAVVLSHLPNLPFGGGFFGVDIFFVLSGFLITSLLLEEWGATSDISLKAFYARRALRLLPALVEVLLVAVAVSAAVETPEQSAAMRSSALMTLFYSANWFVAYRQFPRGELSHAWSLSVEEQFYAVWPVVMLLLLKGGCSRRTIGLLTAAGFAASGAARMILWNTTHSWERVYFGSDTHADGLLAGALVALLLESGVRPRSPAALRVLNWAAHLMMGWLGVFLVLGWAADPYLSNGGYSAMNLGVAVIVMCLMCGAWPPLRMLCESRLLVWIGRISYGVYLWHSILFWLLRHARLGGAAWGWGLLAAVLVGVPAASFYVLERPLLRRFKPRFQRVPP